MALSIGLGMGIKYAAGVGAAPPPVGLQFSKGNDMAEEQPLPNPLPEWFVEARAINALLLTMADRVQAGIPVTESKPEDPRLSIARWAAFYDQMEADMVAMKERARAFKLKFGNENWDADRRMAEMQDYIARARLNAVQCAQWLADHREGEDWKGV